MSAKAFLIGCGPGDAELLTLKAVNTFKQLEVALIDNLVSKDIVALLPKYTLKVYTGKSKGAHSFSQEAINEMLHSYAKNGYTVGRLKAGDPFVFARGSEEAQYLARCGIEVEIVPGLSSALTAPLCAGIAVTARDYASSFSVVTAHLKDNKFNTEWIELLKIKNHTIVILMGLSRAEEISRKTISSGISEDIPTAIIEKASTPQQNTIITTLGKLPVEAKNASSPAVIVIGEAVRLSNTLPHYIHESIKKEAELGLAC
ncbi:MAG: uroporphyrinogen-III C-methyltransferase [Campylobacteraceae bacterium]|jgi:uroporphyrin-III C-methyltransferase|nr:uroporphyrinogen-III C-methyltransferase [Campylobacteraceae bacterium]